LRHPVEVLQLALRPTTFDDGPRQDDYLVIWTSDEYGARRVGRIRLANIARLIAGNGASIRRCRRLHGAMGSPARGRWRPRHSAGSSNASIRRPAVGNGRMPSRSSEPAKSGLSGSVVADDWDGEFDWPIPLPGGGELVTFRDAGDYVAALPKREHDKPEWQLAIGDLMRAAAGHGPWRLLARIAIMHALHGKPEAPIAGAKARRERRDGKVNGNATHGDDRRQSLRSKPRACQRSGCRLNLSGSLFAELAYAFLACNRTRRSDVYLVLDDLVTMVRHRR
jgi:hypothetical protein